MYIPRHGPSTASAAIPETARFYAPVGYCADESVGWLMKRALMSIAQAADRRLEPQGHHPRAVGPLFMLQRRRAATVAELARELQSDPGAMTRLLDRLEAKGLCRRERSTDDRRVVRVELTPEGEVAAQEVPVVLAAGAERAPRRLFEDRVVAIEGHAETDGRQRRSGRDEECASNERAVRTCPGRPRRARWSRTMTTVILALASVVVLALAGCASPRGIEIDRDAGRAGALGAEPAGDRGAGRRRLVARLRRSGPRRPDRARARRLAVACALPPRAAARAAAGVDAAPPPTGPQLDRRVRRDAPALHRERHLPAAARRLDARHRDRAAQRLVGARLLRPQPRRARRRDRRRARRAGRRRGRAHPARRQRRAHLRAARPPARAARGRCSARSRSARRCSR